MKQITAKQRPRKRGARGARSQQPKRPPKLPKGGEQRHHLGDAAYDRLKQAIIECEVLPGEEVSLPVIVDRYELTDAQARHALVRLTQEGWVSAMPRRGYTVTPLTMQDVEDIFELRMMLEPAALRKAAGRIDGETLRRLEAVNEATYIAGDPASIRHFLRENRAYYTSIVNLLGNKMLTRTIEQLFDSVTRLLYFSAMYNYESDLIRQHHQKLLEALLRGDGEEAERLRHSGLQYARENVRKALSSSPSLMAVNLAPPRSSTHRAVDRAPGRAVRAS
jgi:DNA-binding GntR family transcriptional regulator